MPYQIHYFDRRTGEFLIEDNELIWPGDFWYFIGSGAQDFDRCKGIYSPESGMILNGMGAPINLIQVEKIISEGKIVYQEQISPLPPRILALMICFHSFCDLTGFHNFPFLLSKISDEQIRKELPGRIEKFKEAKAALSAIEITELEGKVIDMASEAATKIAFGESTDWNTLYELQMVFSALAVEAVKPFKQ